MQALLIAGCFFLTPEDYQTPPTLAPREMVRAGPAHFCTVDATGGLACEALGDTPALEPARSETWARVAAGLRHTCALSTTGESHCWPQSEPGAAAGEGRTGVADLAVADDYTLLLTVDGAIEVWPTEPGDGAADLWEGPDPSCAAGEDFVALSAWGGAACALTAAGFPCCWGDDDAGQARPNASGLGAVDIGAVMGCGLRADNGELACWGTATEDQPAVAGQAWSDVCVGDGVAAVLDTEGYATVFHRDAGAARKTNGFQTFDDVACGEGYVVALAAGETVVIYGP